ncbi:hypothetical protein [Ahrensia sp. 13_GOM-1096m]|uniref:hypothetical protein n=1 Tax=Ahrensia sp. 13_GOM-1096m TaxID=1380380 RepID=UPI00047897AA|nr:hypothetical protein [Ahrensia sp. 13_GOM-1096m]
MRDIANNIGLVPAIAPAVITATTTGAALDLKGFQSAALIINTGAIAGDGDYTAKLQESDTTTSGDFADVVAEHLIGELPATLEADSVVKQGYIGHKRYLRAIITKNSGTSIAASAALIKGDADVRPVE